MGLISRFFMMLAAPIAALFASPDALNFGSVQMIIAVLLFTALAAGLAFWPRRRARPAPTE